MNDFSRSAMTCGIPRGRATHRIVAIITSRSELRVAARLSNPPDLLELRLDHLADLSGDVEKLIRRLPLPLIITARDYREGGAKRLSLGERRDLLVRFLPYAAFVDVELKSLRALASIFETARTHKVQRILSVHNFSFTPTAGAMIAKARAAKASGAEFFKIATRVDTPRQLARLLEFMEQRPAGLGVSAMGVGRLGAISRIVLSQCGSLMTYAHLGKATLEGQLSLAQIRRAFDALSIG